MSNIQTATISLEEMNRKPLQKMITNVFKVKGISGLKKAELIEIAKDLRIREMEVVTEVNVYGVEKVSYNPIFEKVVDMNAKKVKTTKEAFSILSKVSESLVINISEVMASGVKLHEICMTPEEYVDLRYVPSLLKFREHFNPYFVTIPTREMGLVWVSELSSAKLDQVNGNKEVVVEPRLELRAQNHLIDALCKRYVFIARNEMTGEIIVVSKQEAIELQKKGVNVRRVRDMRYVVSVDYNMPPLPGQNGKLTRDQQYIQARAIINGVYFNFNDRMLCAEYFMSSASERRTIMGTHIVGMDAVEALHTLGMDFRQFAKYKNGKYVLDMIKAPNRFGLASTSSIPSSLIKFGNKIKEYDNGEYAIVGGRYTMKCVDDIYAYVSAGKYMAYDPEKDEFLVLDASEVPYKRNVTDGMLFVDASIQYALAAEFGKLFSAEQVRITPATKGLAVFVPGLKEMIGHDVLAFNSATKGDYRTLLTTNPDFEIEFRVALFNKDAKDAKNITNIPYQFIQTMFDVSHVELLKEKLDGEIEKAFEVYDNPERLAEYLGTRTLDVYNDIAKEELTEEQREHIDGTLVSMFTNFFYAGEFVMKDPYFKKRLLDIIENMIRAWTRGAMPVEGHYRYISTDIYGVMEAYLEGSHDAKLKRESVFVEYDEKGNAAIIVPSHVGIPSNRVVMVDDEDKYFIEGKDIIFNRNPKISTKETAKARGIMMKDYYYARKEYPFAFNNLVFFSCHDFNVVKQGGADMDGDTTHTSMDPVLVGSYKDQPALMDLTLVNGELIEGCPYQPKTKADFDFFGHKYRSDVIVNGVKFNDEFKVTFIDEDYNLDFARQMHELSKVFLLKSLDPNQIGQITNYATRILAAISRLQWSLLHNVDVDSNILDEATRTRYEEEIKTMEKQVDILRLLQGWEIDKAKHGGEFWKALEKQLLFITDPAYYPEFASHVEVNNKGHEIVKFSNLEWHQAVRSRKSLEVKEGKVYPSLMQELRAHVLMRFTTKIKAKFNQLNPSLDTNNLIYDFAPVADVYDHGMVEAVLKMITPIFNEYNRAQKHIIEVRQEFEKQREHLKFNTKHEAELYDRRIKFEINKLMDDAITKGRSEMKALPFDEATVAYIAYAKKYRDYRPSKAISPASGLSAPWILCQEGMMKLVSRVSGKSAEHVRLKEVKSADVKVRFRSFEMAPEKVTSLFNASKRAAVWYHVDKMTGNYLPFVYVGKHRIGILVEESSYYFTGGEKFTFEFKGFELSKSGRSASAVMTNMERF